MDATSHWQQQLDALCEWLLCAGGNRFIANTELDTSLQAIADSIDLLPGRDPALQAGQAFLQAREAYGSGDRPTAAALLERCLEHWQAGGDAPSWEKTALAAFHLGLCHRDVANWPAARQAFEWCLVACERAKREDAALEYVGALAAVLQTTQAWGALQQLAERATLWIGDRSQSPYLAQVRGWQARVALQQSRWHDAARAAQAALEIATCGPLSAAPFHLLLAQARLRLGQPARARESWMTATTLGPGEAITDYRLELRRLQQLYRESDEPLAALELERALYRCERHAGLRAFVGAASLEATGGPAAVPGRDAALADLLACLQAERPPGENCPTILCGPPQAGKRSLLDAGLVPALERQGWRVLRVGHCQHWEAELDAALADRSEYRDLQPTPLWERLQQSQWGRPTALIFDRLETLTDWVPLQTFLARCLQDPHLRVALSLQEVALHRALRALQAVGLADLGRIHSLDYLSATEATAALRSFGIGARDSEGLARELANNPGVVLPGSLQLAGVQLERGGFAMRAAADLLADYLTGVVTACGPGRTASAWLTLYALVDPDSGESVGKTRTELKRFLARCAPAGAGDSLDVVLNVATTAGILRQSVGTPCRYELTTPAFVAPIRQAGERLNARRTQVSRARQQARQQTRDVVAIGTSILATAAVAVAVGWGWQQFVKERERPFREARIRALSARSRQLSQGERPFTALVAALRAARPLQIGQLPVRALSSPTRLQLAVALHEALYTVRERNQLDAHTGAVNAVAMDPAGRIIASAGAEGDLHLWHPDGSLQRSLATGADEPMALATDRGFNAVAIGLNDTIAAAKADGSLYLWQADGQEIARTHSDGAINSVAIAPDNGAIAAGTAAGTLELFDARGRRLRNLAVHDDAILAVAFSPDGRWLATASKDRTVKLFDREGRWQATLSGHSGWVNDVTFNIDGNAIVTASGDGTIGFWSLTGERLDTLTGEHQGTITAVAFSPDGRLFASASSDRTVNVWNESGELLQRLVGHADTVASIAWSPAGDTLVSASRDRSVKIWQLAGAQQPSLAAHPRDVTSLAFSADGKLLASASWDGTVKLWNRAGELLRSLDGHRGAVNRVTFAPNGRVLASAGIDGTVRLWDRRGEQMRALAAHSDWVAAAEFAADGSTLATAGWDGTVKLWDRTGELLQVLPIAPPVDATAEATPTEALAVTSVALSPTEELVAAGSSDGTLHLWQHNGIPVRAFEAHKGPVYGAAFSPDGTLLATGSLDGTVKLWRVADGLELVTLRGHRGGVFALTFSPDGELLATASSDGTVKLWNRRGEALLTLAGDGTSVYGLAFAPDSRVLAAASADGTIALWDLGLDSLIARSCAWLEDYRQEHPDRAIRRLCPGD